MNLVGTLKLHVEQGNLRSSEDYEPPHRVLHPQQYENTGLNNAVHDNKTKATARYTSLILFIG